VVVLGDGSVSPDDLIQLADGVSPTRTAREMDMLLTAGERISMALNEHWARRRVESASFTGSQSGH